MGERGVKKLEKLPTLFADGPLVTLVCYIFLPRTTHQKQGQTCVEHLDSGRWSYLDFCNSNASDFFTKVMKKMLSVTDKEISSYHHDKKSMDILYCRYICTEPFF